MQFRIRHIFIVFIIVIFNLRCTEKKESSMIFTGAPGEVRLITLDPGHFHAALVQKSMYDQVNPNVHIYAPSGPDVQDHIDRINNYNSRADNPTQWELKVYTGDDFLERLVQEKPGNVVVISGKNQFKTQYIRTVVNAGLNVLADKPMCINKTGFDELNAAFAKADQKNVLIYDIMTERYEITTVLQKALSQIPEVFGALQSGTPENSAVTKESVHHFFKNVSGNPLKRPAWFMDVSQQGEGLVDVTAHLVDLIQWECFPDVSLDTTDVSIISAKRWPTIMTKQQFIEATRLSDFPDYLQSKLNANGELPVYSNGEFIYTLKGVYAKVSVSWNYRAPEGAGDTHYSIMRGTKSNLVIRQGKAQNYRPELYVEIPDAKIAENLEQAMNKAISDLQPRYPGISVDKTKSGWHINIPDEFRVGHEAHFAQVTEKYLQYLIDGKLLDWETPNMITKYYTTTAALEYALMKN
ncbi:oxidoreductase [candidate division KSB1 bacterium]|nr:oxidoreductase [candidate division KSB1 bacterium]